jgi:beta-glucosidase
MDGSNGDIACDHYHRLDADLDLIRDLGLKAYRFSVSWSRVQPDGFGAWNDKGLDFYDRLVDGLLERGIAPYLTLYHWDLPQALQDEGGWANRDTVARFVEYSLAMSERYADRVESIATFNEPWIVATLGHEQGIFAPGIKDRRMATQVSHHLLLAHGMAVNAMRAAGVTVPLGIVLNQGPIVPAADTEPDHARAKLEDGLLIRWYMDALFRGRYPGDVLDHLGEDAPKVEEGDMRIIRTPIDSSASTTTPATSSATARSPRRPVPSSPTWAGRSTRRG